MKKILLLSASFIMLGFTCINAQSQDSLSTKGKHHSQSDLFNELYAGYGAGSIYYFTGHISHSYNISSTGGLTDTKSPGAFFFGYSRTLNRIISMGFVASYQEFTYQSYGSTTTAAIDYSDILLSGIARVTFCYVNKPIFRMYSGIGIGITIVYGKVKNNTSEDTDRKLFPAGQITLMGLRVGRALSGFGEFGFGTNGIITLGVSYKFGQ
jgi:hypothetical protein